MKTTLTQWLRLLWNIAPPLLLNSETPYIAAGAIHLPPRDRWLHHTAAAAHAAAHLVYSPRNFEGDGLGAIARALVGLLEDARVEALAMRELPGLVRLWRPLHTATPDTGCGFEALLQRLARALIDPGYDDTDPWVQKGCALFYRDAHSGALALQTPADVRVAALRLGHDIGQMRLQVNGKSYCPAPAYRDDHRWMWAADVLSMAPSPAAIAGDGKHDDSERATEVGETVTLHPEWDRLISRLRPDWCRVIEQQMPLNAKPIFVNDRVNDEAIQQVASRLRRPLRALSRHAAPRHRSDEGDLFDPGALLDWCVSRRLRHATDARVYCGHGTRMARATAWVLIDQSASTAATQSTSGHNILQLATASAIATARALQAMGVACAISGFSSNGRHAVRVMTVKSFDVPADFNMDARAQALRPGGSTRLGAALRHVTSQLMKRRNGALWLLVLSDGEPYDVDVHDPRYLIEDAQHAVHAAARRGVRVVAPVLGFERGAYAQRIFGRQGVQVVQRLSDLPGALTRLIA